ncbi:MAG TPA: elongation factor P [Candidatus Paceibacterota bacterium]|nr:elongation factor P [Candidatus Paceibacterota bacterium]
MLEYNEIRPRKYIVFDGDPYEVIDSHVFRKQQRKPVNATKLKNLITGKIVEHSFHVSDKAEEAELKNRKVKFLYENRGEYWFCEENDPSKRFSLTKEQVGTTINYVKQNSLVDLLSFEEILLGLTVPIKVELKVTEAAPAVKGNTIQGGLKQVTLETGATVNVPMFINEGDVIRVNTESGEYVERV